MNFLIHRDGQDLGPYSEEEILSYLESGNLVGSDLAWHEGAPGWLPLSRMPQFAGSGVAAPDAGVQYHHVAIPKFILLSACTIGLYEVYWFYKNWSFIRQRDQSTIWPIPRAIFSHLFAYWFYRDLQMSRHGTVTATASLAAIAYLIMVLTWPLPDPWWLVSLATFVPLLPMVVEIDRLNRENGVRAGYYARFHIGHGAICLVGAGFILFGASSALQITPSTEVLPGDKLSKRTLEFLKANGMINDSEMVLYFYSAGIFSIKEDGNLLTDQRVISYYWDEELRDIVLDSAFFHEIADVHVTYSGSYFDDTVIVIETDGEWDFVLYASAERKGDRKFVAKLNELRGAAGR